MAPRLHIVIAIVYCTIQENRSLHSLKSYKTHLSSILTAFHLFQQPYNRLERPQRIVCHCLGIPDLVYFGFSANHHHGYFHRNVALIGLLNFFLAINVYAASAVVAEGALSEYYSEFKYHSFKVAVDSFGKECFYQLFVENTTSSVIWHVVSATGAGELAAVVTFKRLSDGKVLYTSAYGQMGNHREESLGEGTYEVCIDNDSYTTKIVYLWFDHIKLRSWDEAVSDDLEVKKYQYKEDMIRNVLRNMEVRLNDMSFYQATLKEKNAYHEASLLKLEYTIDCRSLIAFILSVTTAALQVVFVRKLFNTPASRVTKAGI